VRFLEAGVEAVLLSTECCHLTGEVFDPWLECGAVEGWCNASEQWLGYNLGDTVHTASCGVQAALWLTSEEGL
jgi:hypothetical protein